MTLIEKLYLDGVCFNFYNGIDFDVIMNHSKDGLDGFIFCFVDNFVKEVKKWERESKIDSLLTEKISQKFDSQDIDNNYIAIYQLEGTEPGTLFEVIKEKVLNKNFPEHPWIPIDGLNKGAWRIRKSRDLN